MLPGAGDATSSSDRADAAGAEQSGADPRRWFGPADLARATALHRSLARVQVSRLVAELAVPVVFLAFGVAAHLVRPYPPAYWADRVLVVFVALEAAAFPHRMLFGVRDRVLRSTLGVGDGASSLPVAHATLAAAMAGAGRLALGGALVLGASAIARATPWWPVLLGGPVIGVTLLAAALYPLVVAPLVDRVTPVDGPSRPPEIDVLAGRAGLDRPAVLAAGAELAEGAYVSGFGRSRRLVVAVELLKGPPADLEVVVAHELGHWKLGHHRRSLLAWSVTAAAAISLLWAVDALVRALVPDVGRLDAQLLPLWAVLSVLALSVIQLTLCAVSRGHEREADAFAASLLGDGAHLADHLRRTVLSAGADLEPSRWRALACGYPPPAQRLAALASVSPP